MKNKINSSFSSQFEKVFKILFPSPLSIAIILTIVTFVLALIFQKPEYQNNASYLYDLANFWEAGIWNKGGMTFALQMMLMLVLGYMLALSKPIDHVINWFVSYCNTTSKSALIITFFTILVSLFNWGFGLIFGAIFVKKVIDYSNLKRIKIHKGLLGAAGYSGLMVWHGGLSGSAPIKAAELGNIMSMVTNQKLGQLIPSSIDLNETLFSNMNLFVSSLLLIVLPLFMYFIGTKLKPNNLSSLTNTSDTKLENEIKVEKVIGLEKMDYSRWFGKIIGGLIIFYIILKFCIYNEQTGFKFITPNFINLLLIALALIFLSSISDFLQKLEKAIGSSSGILIQFPLYFGIMGIMKESGLLNEIALFFISISTEYTFPIFTFFSAGLVNIFVPSGGGQWAVQGPVIIESSLQLGIPLGKSIMALAYGDQITNMLQPFWALPLLGITGLKAKEILPYTLLLMAIGTVIFILGISLF